MLQSQLQCITKYSLIAKTYFQYYDKEMKSFEPFTTTNATCLTVCSFMSNVSIYKLVTVNCILHRSRVHFLVMLQCIYMFDDILFHIFYIAHNIYTKHIIWHSSSCKWPDKIVSHQKCPVSSAIGPGNCAVVYNIMIITD